MLKKPKKKTKVIFLSLLLMVVIVLLVYKSITIVGGRSLHDKSGDNKTTLRPSVMVASDPSSSISSNNLNSPHAILVCLNDHTIMMQKKGEEKINPASLTKIITAIVAIENLSNLQEKIELPNSMFKKLYNADASMAGFLPNEQVSAIDLLYGALLPSGGECSIGLADKIAGSEQNFVKMMNQKAAELGMNNTHFDNVTGLDNKNHYTTVKDMTIILSYALKNDTFRKIFTSSSYSTQSTNKHPDGITFNSTMFEKLNGSNIGGGKILGGKTGYTDKAGLCLASLAKVGGKEYILITVGAKGNHKSEQYNITDALTVYNNLGKK
ncbi:D-alanyl-D-alanine carboxypeptidase [Clostridium sp. CM027]|uniref:D-alanyl-D-alanine carboxypeptidase family protein n=1 Tax=Clostridium sp. CM027 TaxID=2849865 RepID=UPI001C6E5950|nr:D-alanyl-D-alanine carboxypeptidase [Clostridium sp. CM027]MBW9144996.1 D-alanyl-D-alanine carboxypeptidase [Clostridium sp. CM027]UVE40130.1 D-alanyl-D-alanine carboxypeptidase [Clostridium sp. CM027]